MVKEKKDIQDNIGKKYPRESKIWEEDVHCKEGEQAQMKILEGNWVRNTRIKKNYTGKRL